MTNCQRTRLMAHLIGLAFGAILILSLAGAVVASTRVLGW